MTKRKVREKFIVWSNGGGVQSTALLALMLQGRIEKPDVAIISDTGYEKSSTWEYIEAVHRPALEKLGITLQIISAESTALRGNDIFRDNILLIPAYTKGQKGAVKGRNFCSGLWKRDVVRYAMVAQGRRYYTQWMGISIDESNRMKVVGERAHVQPRYPLIELGLSRADCIQIVKDMGWPSAPRSSCYICPHMSDDGWRQLLKEYPEDFSKGEEIDRRTASTGQYLRRSLIPLEAIRTESSQTKESSEEEIGCDSGSCWT